MNQIFLISPLLKLLGFGYTVWFIVRYLRTVDSRRQLATQIRDFRKQVSGSFTDFEGAIKSPSSIPTTVVPTQAQEQQAVGVIGTVQVSIPLAGVVDLDLLRSKLQKDLTKAEAEAQSLSQRLSNPKFVDKAPADVVQNARTALAEAEKQVEILRSRMDRL